MSHEKKEAPVTSPLTKFTDPYGLTDAEIFTTKYGGFGSGPIQLENLPFIVRAKADEMLKRVSGLKFLPTGAIDPKDRTGILKLNQAYTAESKRIVDALNQIIKAYVWARFSTADAKASVIRGDEWITQKPIQVATANVSKVITLPKNLVQTSTTARTNITVGALWYLEWMALYKILIAANGVTQIPK